MKIVFEVEIKPNSQSDQDRLNATTAALQVLLSQVKHIEERLIESKEFMASGEVTYIGTDPADEIPEFKIIVTWTSDAIRPM